MLKFLKEAFGAVGEFQSRLILTVFYFGFVPLFAVMAWVAGDPLGLREFRASGQSCWKKRNPADATLEAARGQS